MQNESERNFSEVRLTSAREITWSVQNLDSIRRPLNSPNFVFQNATWCLRLYLSNADAIGLTIVRLSSRVPRHKLKYSLQLKNRGPTRCYEAADFDENHEEAGDRDFASRHYVRFAEEGIVSCLRESIDVICEMSCYGLDAADGFSQTELWMQEAKDVEALCRDFKNMLLNGQNHDVLLKVKDKEFRAHRDVLRARCPVFRSMLDHDMAEKNGEEVDIPDCDPSAFQQFLSYLYGGEVFTLEADNMLSLYYITNKYDAGHLKEKCREFIKKSLSTRNITDVVQTALDHSDEELLRFATDYFVEEMNEILPTVEWLSFVRRNTVRANELIIKAVKDLTHSKEMAE